MNEYGRLTFVPFVHLSSIGPAICQNKKWFLIN